MLSLIANGKLTSIFSNNDIAKRSLITVQDGSKAMWQLTTFG